MQRRGFLRLIGGGVVLAAATGATTFLTTRDPARARVPWDMAGGARYADPRLHALSYAILAPNPHNRQPWLADVRTAGEVSLRIDASRLLPVTDPLNRQITIGLGCFLELMSMAAAETGHRLDIDVFPDGRRADRLTDGRIAITRFVRDSSVAPDPLFTHVLARRSNKEPFDMTRPLDPAAVKRIAAAGGRSGDVGHSVERASIDMLRRLTAQALRIEIETPRTYRESVDLFRIGKREIEANPDGIDLPGPMIETLAALGQFDRVVLLDPSSTAHREGAKAVLANAETAMGHIWLVTPGNDRRAQIAAGRDWVRFNLAATREGIGFHPLSQALQEYPEMAGTYRTIHEKLAPSGGTVQMLCRLGYGPAVAAAPRWPLERKLITA